MLRKIFLGYLFVWLSTYVITGHAKPTAPVVIQYEQTRSTDDDINQLILKFTPTQTLTALQVVIKPSQTINIIDGTLTHLFPAIQAGEQLTIPLSFIFTENNTGYLSIFATTSTIFSKHTRGIKLQLGQRISIPLQGNLKQAPIGHTGTEKTIRMQGDRR